MSRALVRPSGEIIGRPPSSGLYVWALAVLVGALAAAAVWMFHTLVIYLQFVSFGASAGRLSTRLIDLPLHARLIGPVVGGAVIALLLRVGVSAGWGPAPRPYGLQDVVQNRRLRGAIRTTTLSLRDGVLSALIAVVSLGWGGSAGREEPAAHLGASLAVLQGRLLGLDVSARRMLAGMGVAAAFAASLHAPIAGVFLARELVLRGVRLHALGPVALASGAGWMMSRWLIGPRPVISLPEAGAIPPEAHAAALVLLPLLVAFAAGAAFVWARTPDLVAAAAGRMRIPLWLLPVVGGLFLGLVAMTFPQALGVGFEPLAAGAAGNYGAQLLPVLALAKIAATAITFGFRWGGGPIAPMLFVGTMAGASLAAIVGLALGIAAPQAYFAFVGMGVGVSVLLGAPITGAMLALELSRSVEVGGACLVLCFLGSLIARRFFPGPPEEPGRPLRWR